MNIRTVNLLWETKLRGSYPVGPYSVENDGTVTRAVPRTLETRAYDISRIAQEGTAQPQSFFSAETLLKLDTATQGDTAMGMTADDIYLFRDGGKTRFLTEGSLTYLDAALNASGRALVVAYSDRTGANFALACGDINGRVAWTREFDATPITAVAISRDGRQIACGAENGKVWRISSGMRDQWEFEQPEPISALAASADGTVVAYGTSEGTVGWIDNEGVRRWEMKFPGSIVSLALSAEGEVCAALCELRDGSGVKLACLVGNGQVGWEFDTEKRLKRVALSPNGMRLAASGRDGTTTLYEIVPGEAQAFAPTIDSGAISRAETLTQSGDWAGAYRLLQAALDADPTNAELCDRVLETRSQWRASQLTVIEALRDAQNWMGVVDAAETVLKEDPRNPHAMAMLNAGLQSRGEQLLVEAKAQAQTDSTAAESLLLQAVNYAPLLAEARRELRSLRTRRAGEFDATAERLLSSGNLEAGVTALEQAQIAAPDAERAQKLNRVQIAAEFAAGKSHYDAKRYEQAIFQFRKTLARDPAHTDAKRYLNFAEKFAQDAASDVLADRFQRLE